MVGLGVKFKKIQDNVLEKSFFFYTKNGQNPGHVNLGHCEIQ